MPSAVSANPPAATMASRSSIGIVKRSVKYLSRNATPKNSMTTPMRVSALPPASHSRNRFERDGVAGAGVAIVA